MLILLMFGTSATVFSIDKEPEQKSKVEVQDISLETDRDLHKMTNKFHKKYCVILNDERLYMSFQSFYQNRVIIPDKNKISPDRLILNIYKCKNYI